MHSVRVDNKHYNELRSISDKTGIKMKGLMDFIFNNVKIEVGQVIVHVTEKEKKFMVKKRSR